MTGLLEDDTPSPPLGDSARALVWVHFPQEASRRSPREAKQETAGGMGCKYSWRV